MTKENLEQRSEKILCSNCHDVVNETNEGKCPHCGASSPVIYHFKNSDEYLNRELPKILKKRKINGLEGLVGDLDCLIANTELVLLEETVREILENTGMELYLNFCTEDEHVYAFKGDPSGSPRLLVKARLKLDNPFMGFNLAKKARDMPNSRIETFVFETKNLEKYVNIQKERGINFMTEEIQRNKNYSFIQTVPSHYIGSSYGFIQWHQEPKIDEKLGAIWDYCPDNGVKKKINLKKPDLSFLKNIKYIDHTATRIRARDRDAGIIEFMELTNYNFDNAFYAKDLNSITSVCRYKPNAFAMVFTSGITPFIGSENTGPTEKYTFNYGTRVHHIAFHTEKIESTFNKLKSKGMEFLIELVGGPSDGLYQCFTEQSDNTMLVKEYIHRYGDFKGFFTQSNVRNLTKSTEKQ